MGLLSKAEGRIKGKKSSSKACASLDDLGKTITERIKTLPQDENTPHTVLSLLKTHANFNSGICLSLKNGVYSSYSSLGAGVDKLSIPQEKIWSEDKANLKYFKYDLNPNKDFEYWIFPIHSDGSKPWNIVMLLEAADNTFNADSTAEIIAQVSDKLCINEGADETSDAEPVSGEHDKIKKEIIKFQEANDIFNCVIFDGSKEDHLDFSMKVSEMVNTLGTVIPLSPSRPLVLFSGVMDYELLTHRLSKSLNTTPLLSFESDSADSVMSRIQPLIEDGSGNEQVFTFQI